MDRLQAMYKNNAITQSCTVNLKQKTKIERSKKRNELYLNSRAISPDCDDEGSKKAKDTKSRGTQYLEKFIAWKENKTKQLAVQKSTRRILPFVSAVTSSSKRIERLMAPINHVFTAPKGLKDPTQKKIGKQSLRSQKINMAPENYIFTQPKPKCMPKKIIEPKEKPFKVENIVKTESKVETPPPLKSKQKAPLIKPMRPLERKQKVEIVKPVTNIVKSKQPKETKSTFKNPKSTIKNPKKKQPHLQINCGLLNEPLLNPSRSCPIAETPTDHTVPHPFSKFITSTKRKSPFKDDFDISNNLTDIISPIEFENAPNVNFDEITKNNECLAENVKLIGKINNVCIESPINHVYNPKKFKFVRYSNAKTPKSHRKTLISLEINKENGKKQQLDAPYGNVADLNATPVSAIKLRLSKHVRNPFVSVKRGKGNQKIEEQMDMVQEWECDTSAVLEYKLAIENINYYRKQVNDETVRLLAMCNTWDKYKEDNISKPQENSVEMIDVVVGQTKLLLNKKFQQFVGLIDKCEKGALERKAGAKQSEAMPVLCGDLEGFWSMIYIQVDNLEKRFNNLNRWKENNWSDPDEIIIKTKKNLTKVKKIPIQKPGKASSALRALMKKAHADYVKTKVTNEDNCAMQNIIQVLTPEAYRRRSKIASPFLKNSPKLKNFVKSTHKSKAVAVYYHEDNIGSSQKKFQIIDVSDNKESTLEENELRSYTLRGRRVILRDSLEFEIPT